MTRTSFLLFFVGMLSRKACSALCSYAGVEQCYSEELLFLQLSSILRNPSSPTPTILPRTFITLGGLTQSGMVN